MINYLTNINVQGTVTISDLLTANGGINLTDNLLNFGTGNNDMSMFHTGSHGYIDMDTGSFYIRGASNQNNFIFTQTGNFNLLGGITAVGNISGNVITSTQNVNVGNDLVVTGNVYAPNLLSLSNADINITPNGTGEINLNKDTTILGLTVTNNITTATGTITGNSFVSNTQATANNQLVRLDQLNSIVGGLDWQESVLDQLNLVTSEPASPTVGDRYISLATGTSSVTSQAVTIHYIYEWNGTDWTEFIPNEGWTVWIEDIDTNYTYNGSTWVEFGSTVSHNNTTGLQGGQASQYYHLNLSDYTNLTADSANLAYTNVDNNFSVHQNFNNAISVYGAINLKSPASASAIGTIRYVQGGSISYTYDLPNTSGGFLTIREIDNNFTASQTIKGLSGQGGGIGIKLENTTTTTGKTYEVLSYDNGEFAVRDTSGGVGQILRYNESTGWDFTTAGITGSEDALFGGNVTIDNGSYLYFGSQSLREVTANNSIRATAFEVLGLLRGYGNLTISGITTLNGLVDINNNVDITGTLDVSGRIDTDSDITFGSSTKRRLYSSTNEVWLASGDNTSDMAVIGVSNTAPLFQQKVGGTWGVVQTLATQNWVTSQIQTVDTLQEVTDNGATTTNEIVITRNTGQTGLVLKTTDTPVGNSPFIKWENTTTSLYTRMSDSGDWQIYNDAITSNILSLTQSGGLTLTGGSHNFVNSNGVTIDIDSSAGDGKFRFQDGGVTKWHVGRDNTNQNFAFSPGTGLGNGDVLTLATDGTVSVTGTFLMSGTTKFSGNVYIDQGYSLRLYNTAQTSWANFEFNEGTNLVDISRGLNITGGLNVSSNISTTNGFAQFVRNADATTPITLLKLENEFTGQNVVYDFKLGSSKELIIDGTSSSSKIISAQSVEITGSLDVSGGITGTDLEINLVGTDNAVIYGENDAQFRVRGTNDHWSGIGFKGSTGTEGFLFYNSVNEYFQFSEEVRALKGLDVTVTDSDRSVNIFAPNGENRFNLYAGGTGNSSYLQMYDHTGSTIGVQLNSAGISYINGTSLVLGGTVDSGYKFRVLGTSSLEGNTNIAGSLDVSSDVTASTFTANGGNSYFNAVVTDTYFRSDSTILLRDNKNNNVLIQSADTVTNNRTLTFGNATYSNYVFSTGNVTAPNFIGNVIAQQITNASTSAFQIRNNAGQPIATFADNLNSTFNNNVTVNGSIGATDGTNTTKVLYYGITFDRASNYIRPTTNGGGELYFGGSTKGQNDYTSVKVYTDGVNDFQWNDEVVATQDWVDTNYTVVDKSLSLTLRVKNTESIALSKGQVVCAAPSATPPSGNIIEVKLADNNGTDSMPAIGILNEDLDAAGGANDEGEAIMFGRISGIDTSAFSVGDEVFVSDTAGGLTTTKPTGVKYIQKVGVVVRDSASNGTIEVFGAGRTNDVPTPLYVDHTNQRLGIGTTSPLFNLHVVGTEGGDGTYDGGILIENNNTSSDGEPTLAFRVNSMVSSNKYWFTGLNQSANYKIGYGTGFFDSDTFFTITDTGNVGIGTTTPTFPLDVETSNEIVASFTSTDNKASIKISDNDTSVFVSAENSKASFGFNSGVNANNLNIDTAGNVGIGTSGPSFKLDVNGTFRTNGLWTTSSAVTHWGSQGGPTAYGTLTWGTGYASVYANAGNELRLGANGNTSGNLIIDTAGNIDITGTLNVSGLSTLSGGLTVQDSTIKVGSSTGTNAVDSGTIDFLEDTDSDFGSLNGYGFRLNYNGDTNDFTLQSGSDTTVTNVFRVDRGATATFEILRNTDITGILDVTNEIITSSSANATPTAETAVFSKFGLLANRGSMYFTNAGGDIRFGVGATHSASNTLTINGSGINVTGTITNSGTIFSSGNLFFTNTANRIYANSDLILIDADANANGTSSEIRLSGSGTTLANFVTTGIGLNVDTSITGTLDVSSTVEASSYKIGGGTVLSGLGTVTVGSAGATANINLTTSSGNAIEISNLNSTFSGLAVFEAKARIEETATDSSDFVNNPYHLELRSPDTLDSTDYISIRFHHMNQTSGAIRYNSQGFFFQQGNSSTYRDVYVRDVISDRNVIANGDVQADEVLTTTLRTSSGQELVLNAGESVSYATGQTDEYVYVNAESGLVVTSSPDNWASGWTNRTTGVMGTLGNADGKLRLGTNSADNILLIRAGSTIAEITSGGIDITGNIDFSGVITGNGSGLTNVNADTLDSINSTQFLRSDTTDIFDGNDLYLRGNTRIQNNLYLEVSSTDLARQRVDARTDNTDKARLHWYGQNGTDGGVDRFREAWYDGSKYMYSDITNLGSSAVGLTLSNSSTLAGAYVQLGLFNSTDRETSPQQWFRAYRATTFGQGRVAIGVGNADRLTINYQGNVAIGTTPSTTHKFVVAGNIVSTNGKMYLSSGNQIYFDYNGSNDYAIRKSSSDLAFTSGGDFTFNSNIDIEDDSPFLTIRGTNSSYSNAGIQLISGNASNNRALGVFHYVENSDVEWFAGLPYGGNDAYVINRNTGYTSPSSQSSPVGIGASQGRLFTITNSGNVGIGTDTPDFKLDVAGDIGIDGKIYHNGDHNTYIGFDADTQTFRTAGVDALTINSVQDVILTEDLRLSVNKVARFGGTHLIYFDGSNTFHQQTSGAMYYYNNADTHHTWHNNSTQRMRLDGTGTETDPVLLRIHGEGNNTNDDSKIILSQGNSGSDLEIIQTGVNTRTDGLTANDQYIRSGQRLNLWNRSNGSAWNTKIQLGYGYISFGTNAVNSDASTRMIIDSSGNVGIGTTSPSSKLHIAYTGTGGTGIFGVGEGLKIQSLSPNITFDDTSNNIDSYAIHLNQNVFTLGRYTSSTSMDSDLVLKQGSVSIGTASPGAYKFRVNGTSKFDDAINVDGQSIFNDPLTIQSTVASGVANANLIIYNDTNGAGAGIKFSDNATTQSQYGTFKFFHGDTSFAGVNNQVHWKFESNQGSALGLNLPAGGSYSIGNEIALFNIGNDVYLRNTINDGDIFFQSDDGAGGNSTYYYIDGGNLLNRFTQSVMLEDDKSLIIGTGLDLTLFHESASSTTFLDINTNALKIRDASNVEKYRFNQNGNLQLDSISVLTGQQLVLNAGESAAQATGQGQTGEYVYLNAEYGLQINTSPDNWATGWAGRVTHQLSGDNVTFRANTSIIKDEPWFTLDSSSSGSNTVEQAAGISLGESGTKGNAAVHITYTGDGKGWLGMGTVTNAVPAYKALTMLYNEQRVGIGGNYSNSYNVNINGTTNVTNNLTVAGTGTFNKAVHGNNISTTTSEGAYNITRTFTNSRTGSARAFADDTIWSSNVQSLGYAGWDNRAQFNNCTFNHHTAFQSRPRFDATTITDYEGVYIYGDYVHDSTITNWKGVIVDTPYTFDNTDITNFIGLEVKAAAGTNGASITNFYGLKIDTVNATNKWAIYSSNVDVDSWHRGEFSIGGTSPGTADYDFQANKAVFRKPAYFEADYSVSSGTVFTLDVEKQVNELLLHAGNFSISNTISNISNTAGLIITIIIVQDGTGSRTITSWGTGIEFGDAGAPTLSTGANKMDMLSFYSDGYKLFFMGIQKGFSNYQILTQV